MDEILRTELPEEEFPIDPPEPPETPESNQYYHVIFTYQGLSLLAKQQMGAPPVVTQAVAGSGYVDAIDLEQQVGVSDPIAAMEIGPRQLLDDAVVRLQLRLTNENLESTALIRQVGIYALDPDEGEILYQLLQYDLPQPLPSTAANRGAIAVFECEIDLTFANGEAAAIPTAPGWFLNQSDMDAHNADPEAHLGEILRLSDDMVTLEEDFAASQAAQDVRIKLLEDTLITDIQDNKRIIVFGDLSGINLIQGVYNAAHSRVEC